MSKPIINLPGKRERAPLVRDLEPGDVFLYHEKLYMKVPKVMCYDTNYDHCVLSLQSGKFVKPAVVDEWSKVIPMKVTMNVEYE